VRRGPRGSAPFAVRVSVGRSGRSRLFFGFRRNLMRTAKFRENGYGEVIG